LAALEVVKAYMVYNRSPLTHVDRGRALREAMLTALNELKPAGKRGLGKEWHPYIILYDEYVEGRKTTEIMSELFISEQTFYRTRRESIAAVAKVLMEMEARVKNDDISK